jgi:hypothetical protein
MDLWNQAYDEVSQIERRVAFDAMTVAEQLEVAKIHALLSISQELSGIHHEGINPEYRSD